MAHLHLRPAIRLGAIAFTVVLAGVGCTSSDTTSTTGGSGGGGGGGGGGKKIALLLPETKTARYETQDKPLFEAKVKALCSDCQVLYSNADQDAAKQQSQAEA